jgi:hypothetical protein
MGENRVRIVVTTVLCLLGVVPASDAAGDAKARPVPAGKITVLRTPAEPLPAQPRIPVIAEPLPGSVPAARREVRERGGAGTSGRAAVEACAGATLPLSACLAAVSRIEAFLAQRPAPPQGGPRD